MKCLANDVKLMDNCEQIFKIKDLSILYKMNIFICFCQVFITQCWYTCTSLLIQGFIHRILMMRIFFSTNTICENGSGGGGCTFSFICASHFFKQFTKFLISNNTGYNFCLLNTLRFKSNRVKSKYQIIANITGYTIC